LSWRYPPESRRTLPNWPAQEWIPSVGVIAAETDLLGKGKSAAVELDTKHLGNRYGRTFANHWELVRHAKEQQLDLDFTTPPKRPARP